MWQHPAREAKVKKNKGVGALKGIGMGLMGVIIKPPVGVIDGVTNLLNGIGNGTNLARLRKQGERVRTRRERMVYGPMSHIRPYKAEDALVWDIMCELRRKYEYGDRTVLRQERYLGHVITLEDPMVTTSLSQKGEVKFSRLIMTDHRVLNVAIRKTKSGFVPRVLWSILWEDLGGVEKSDCSRILRIRRKPRKQNKEVVQYDIFCYLNKKSYVEHPRREDYVCEANRIQSKISEYLSLYFSQS